MNGSGPLLGSLHLWAERETMCLKTLERALVLLQLIQHLPETEDELNRRLYGFLLTANRELYPENDIPPAMECNNQPDLDDEVRTAREQKRPDFQWIFVDRYESDPHRSSKQFVVECKRLGKPNRPDWVFNLNYVRHGVCRFRDPKWAYAQRFASGAMVGYCQNMPPPQVLKEVNAEARRNSLPDLVSSGTYAAGGDRLEHAFDRSFDVSPFVSVRESPGRATD